MINKLLATLIFLSLGAIVAAMFGENFGLVTLDDTLAVAKLLLPVVGAVFVTVGLWQVWAN